MKGFALVEGAQRREFADVVWQIADKRGCDEVAIRYDCGHALRADVWAPTLPKTREYGVDQGERRRFMQHSIFVMTREPGAPRVQITVPEGFCRLCNRGQRQTLICGPLQMDLTDAPGARRLELPLSSHAFLAVMGQVCRLPESISTPPIPQGKDGSLKPFDGPQLPQQGLRQWSRREAEDALRTEVRRYVAVAMAFLVLLGLQALYLARLYLAPAASALDGESPFAGAEFMAANELRNISTVGSLEQRIVNSTWVLSLLTVAVHKTFAPDSSLGPDDVAVTSAWLWSYVLHPLWVTLTVLLVPLAMVGDLVVAAGLRVVYSFTKDVMWRPATWAAVDIAKWLAASTVVFVQTFVVRPAVVLYHIPVLNPLIVAVLLSLLVAAVSAPQPPSLSLPSLWSELPSLDLPPGLKRALGNSKCLGPFANYFKNWGSRKDSKAKGGRPGVQPGRGGGRAAGGRGADAGPGRPEKDGKAASSTPQPAAPPCCVCLDRPSRYILEPCGHRVVCGECAVQLVEAAARNRSMSEGAGGGGACPSCGMAISRAMRLFT